MRNTYWSGWNGGAWHEKHTHTHIQICTSLIRKQNKKETQPDSGKNTRHNIIEKVHQSITTKMPHHMYFNCALRKQWVYSGRPGEGKLMDRAKKNIYSHISCLRFDFFKLLILLPVIALKTTKPNTLFIFPYLCIIFSISFFFVSADYIFRSPMCAMWDFSLGTVAADSKWGSRWVAATEGFYYHRIRLQ